MAESNPGIHKDPEILGGTPVFIGTRVPVKILFDYLEAGDSLEVFLEEFPSVTREQAVAALELAREGAAPDAHSAWRIPASETCAGDYRTRGSDRAEAGLGRFEERRTASCKHPTRSARSSECLRTPSSLPGFRVDPYSSHRYVCHQLA